MNRQDAWRQIAEMTDTMLSHARSGEWNHVITVERARQLLMQGFFAQATRHEDAVWIAEGIRSVMKSDRKIMDLGKTDMDRLGENLGQIQRGRAASRAYKKLA